jgi:hypothetical protein
MSPDARKPWLTGPLARALAVGLMAFLLVAWALNTLVRALPIEPRIAVLTHKLRYLEQHADEFDTIFAGTSRMHFQLDPAAFDAEMARLGCVSRSFNMGVHALIGAEQRHLLRRLAEIGRGRWRWIFIERNQLPARPLRSIGTERQYYFMSELADLWLSLRSIWTSQRRRRDKVIDTGQLLASYLHSQLAPGQLTRLLPRAGEDGIPDDGRLIDLSRAGFVPVERETEPELVGRAARLDRDELARLLARTRAHDGRFAPLSDARATLFAQQIERARQVAPNVGFIIFPEAWPNWLNDGLAIERAGREGRLGDVTVVNLGDPRRHPELFVERLWFDLGHVIEEGARMLSTYLARELCPAVTAQGS